ncbi:MAG: hypothetical protein HIU81_02535 [Acidobacteria bacterium]|nr:hypothetical protein [Acidobacteriota bacterium]
MDSKSLLAVVLVCVCCIAALTVGTFAYTGRWRSWAPRFGAAALGKHSLGGFMFLFGGIVLASLPLGLLAYLAGVPDAVLRAIVLVPAIGGLLLTLMSFFWLPRFMLPRWYKDWVDSGAEQANLYRTSNNKNHDGTKQKRAS